MDTDIFERKICRKHRMAFGRIGTAPRRPSVAAVGPPPHRITCHSRRAGMESEHWSGPPSRHRRHGHLGSAAACVSGWSLYDMGAAKTGPSDIVSAGNFRFFWRKAIFSIRRIETHFDQKMDGWNSCYEIRPSVQIMNKLWIKWLDGYGDGYFWEKVYPENNRWPRMRRRRFFIKSNFSIRW